jgi:hypothetical protein
VRGSDISEKPLWNPAKGSDKSEGLGNLEVPDMSGQGPRHVQQTLLESGQHDRICLDFAGEID